MAAGDAPETFGSKEGSAAAAGFKKMAESGRGLDFRTQNAERRTQNAKQKGVCRRLSIHNKVFGKHEAVFLTVNLITARFFIGLQMDINRITGTAAWLHITYRYALAFLIFAALLWLFRPFEKGDLLDAAETALGKFGKTAAGLVLAIFFIIKTAITLRYFTENLIAIMLNNSPYVFVAAFFVIAMSAAAYKGFLNIGRLAAVFVPVIITFSLLVLAAVFQFYNPRNLLPILGNGLRDNFTEGFLRVDLYSELIVLFILAPEMADGRREFGRVCFTSLLVSFIIALLFTLSFNMLVSYPADAKFTFPIYETARLVRIGPFGQRLEVLATFAWNFSLLLYFSAGLSVTTKLIRKALDIDFSKPLIPVCAMIIFLLSVYFHFSPEKWRQGTNMEDFWSKASWVVFPVLPAALLLLARMRKSTNNKQ